jgi:hypothetical protein
MAVKYWYVAGNGSSNYNTAGVWFNGSGGTGGVTTTPTAADDVILNAASGSGTLTFSASSSCNSFNASTFTGTVAGISGLSISTSSVANNNSVVLQLGGTWNYTGTITFTTTLSAPNYLSINCNGIFHKGGMTFNSAIGTWQGLDPSNFDDPIRMTGLFSLAAGSINSTDIYAGTISSSNSGVRSVYCVNIYLSGTGTLLSATTQTNLSWSANNLYLTNTSATNKSLSIGGIVYFDNVYLQGSGASATTLTFAVTSVVYPNVIISKMDGSFLFGTSYISDLIIIEGSNITWAGTSTLTVYKDVTLCNSMFITTSNALTFAGAAYFYSSQVFTTFNKTFTGNLTVNDAGANGTQLNVNGNYISSSSSSSSISIVSASQVSFNGSITTAGGITINTVAAGGFPTVDFYGGITSATNLSIADGNVFLGSTFLSGALTVSSGNLQLLTNSVHSILTFTSSSSTAYRSIFLGINTTINLRGSAANTWNTSQGIAQGVLYFDPGTSTINITDNTSSQVLSFQTGGCDFYNIHINRSNNSSVNPLITFTGSFFCRNFRDFTVMSTGVTNIIAFTGGTTVAVSDTFQVGNDINQTSMGSTSSTLVNIVKINPGLVICPRLILYNLFTSQANTFYAIKGSLDNQGNGAWIFNTPPRRLSSLGAG